jgi:general secretion pathway protein J
MRIADGFIRRYVSQVFPAWERENDRPGARWRLNFQGSEEELRFITYMPPHLGVGGLHEMTLAVRGSSDEQQIIVRRNLVHPELDREQLPEDERVLIDHVLLGQFAYFGSAEKNSPPQWQETWQAMAQLPSLIRLRITTRDAGSWPDLVIPLRADSVRFGRSVRRAVAGSGERAVDTRAAPAAQIR